MLQHHAVACITHDKKFAPAELGDKLLDRFQFNLKGPLIRAFPGVDVDNQRLMMPMMSMPSWPSGSANDLAK